MTDTSLTSAARAMGRLASTIEFGRSVQHPGLADSIDRAGYAMANVRVQIESLRDSIIREKVADAPA
jgi:hypothetical protein